MFLNQKRTGIYDAINKGIKYQQVLCINITFYDIL